MKLKNIGAKVVNGGVEFSFWAPHAASLELLYWSVENKDGTPQTFPMNMQEQGELSGYFTYFLKGARDQDLYKIRKGGKTELPDPASRYQPEGPHGRSQVVAADFDWKTKNFKPCALDELVIYELHIGTFSEESSFESAAKKLPELKELGINAIEIMPVAQFSGARNWGYDGVGLFAVQNTYGQEQISPLAFKSFIDSCHSHEIAVLLDVVYNHLGPEGNYLPQLGPYFQSKYKTPWGDALNYDDRESDEVRNFFLQNARQWLEEFRIDGLRLDAVHAIFDTSAKTFLEELSVLRSDLVEKHHRPIYLIAESDASDPKLLNPIEKGGLNLDAHWADDFHHILHATLTGETMGYYEGYGGLRQLARVFERGVLFEGEYSPPRGRRHGRSYENIERFRLVFCAQNHDQIGNRKDGDRLISQVGFEKAKLASSCVLLSPGMPLIFMGEEWGAQTPFQYFVDHQDKELLKAVQKGRAEEFQSFAWRGKVPDPGALETFKESTLNWEALKGSARAREMYDYFKKLISLSKRIRRERLFEGGKVQTEIDEDRKLLRINGDKNFTVLFSFLSESQWVPLAEKSEVLLASRTDIRREKSQIELSAFGVIAYEGGNL